MASTAYQSFLALTPEQKKAKIQSVTGSVPLSNTPTATPANTGGMSYKPPTAQPSMPAYGSNIANFDASNAQHTALADAGQQYATAKVAGNTAGMSAARALGDQIRSGVQGASFDSVKGVSTLPTAQPNISMPPPDFNALASAEQERFLAERQRIADQQKAGLTSAFTRSNEILQGNRTLEDFELSNTLSPFSGRTSYAKGLTGRERTLADESAQGNFNTAIQGVEQGLANDKNTAAQEIMARAYQLQQDAKRMGMDEAQIFGTNSSGQTSWAANPNNPQNAGQTIQNKISQLNLDALPQEIKLNIDKLQQEVDTGKMTNEAAEYNLNELTDPNSATNQAKAIDLQMKQLEAKNLPEKQRLELQQLKKQIAQIGVVHYKPQTEAEIAMDKVKLETAQEQLKQLQNGSKETPKFNTTLANTLKNQFTTKNNITGQETISNPVALRSAIIASTTTDEETDQMLIFFGLPINE